jgi:hypothetical protein
VATGFLFAGMAVAAPAGHAYKLAGKKWPTRTITYHSAAPQYDEALGAAVRAWNSSGVRIRFKPAPRRRAKLRIVYAARNDPDPGRATLGWVRIQTYTAYLLHGIPVSGHVRCGMRMRLPEGDFGRVRCRRITQRPYVWLRKVPAEHLRDPFYRNEMELIAAHELGHVLGLDHARNRCAVMSYERDFACPRSPHEWQFRCRLLEEDDVRGALRRYGGRMGPLGPAFCDRYAAPAAPVDLAATADPDTQEIVATWTNSAAPESRFVGYAAGLEACPAEPDAGGLRRLVEPGTRDTATLGAPEPGRYCVAVWSEDQFGRRSAPATAWVDVPPL